MSALLGRRGAALAMLFAMTTGCSWFRGGPEPVSKLADRMRSQPVPLEQLRAAAATGPQRNVLWLREAYLAELPLGATAEQVKRRWGEPTRFRQTPLGTWWEYDETYPKPGPTPEPAASGAPPDEKGEPHVARVGMNLRLLFVDAVAPPPPPGPEAPLPAASAGAGPAASGLPAILAQASADPVPTTEPSAPAAVPTPLPTPTPRPQVLAHIQAWAPARFQTRSLVRVLDPVVRIERKYGKAPKVLPWGGQGGEVWLYPAANVAFVVTPMWAEQPRYVAATLVGF